MFIRSRPLFRNCVNYCMKSQNVYASKKAAVSAPSSSPDGIVLSDSCVQRLKQLCDNNNTFLRLCVESGGCSGFQYKFDLDEKISKDDRVFERDGVKVVVDETSLSFIKGATIDYHTELIRAAFRVEQNPNAELGCSCGASFSIKID